MQRQVSIVFTLLYQDRITGQVAGEERTLGHLS